jgi:hypothetical protein
MEQFKLEEKINAEEKIRSLNGFEEIAIAKAFGDRIEKLSETEMVRAIVFTLAIREGSERNAAFQYAMKMSWGELQDLCQPCNELEPDEQEEFDTQYADFVIGTRMSWLPDQYRELTIGQRIAIIEAANRREG